MTNTEHQLNLNHRLSVWSDQAQKTAVEQAERFRDLLGRRITNAKLAGLNNIVRSAPSFEKVKEFVRSQKQKEEKQDHFDVTKYWIVMGQMLEKLENDAWQLATDIGLELPSKENKPKKMREALGWLYLRLAQEYIQHLVAHSLMLSQDIRNKQNIIEKVSP
jgi:hypothetical protein